MSRLLALTLLLLAPAASLAEEPRLIDRVVAVVAPGGMAERRRLITLSELEYEARIALIRAGGIGAADGEIPKDTLAATLNHLINEHLLQAEADELAVVPLDPADVRAELDAFKARFPSPEAYAAFLARTELREPELRAILRRALVVDRYITSRARLASVVSDTELRNVWRRNGGKDEGFDAARPALREAFEKRKREDLVAALVADLRSRAREVRVVHDLGGHRAAPPPPRPEPTSAAAPIDMEDGE